MNIKAKVLVPFGTTKRNFIPGETAIFSKAEATEYADLELVEIEKTKETATKKKTTEKRAN